MLDWGPSHFKPPNSHNPTVRCCELETSCVCRHSCVKTCWCDIFSILPALLMREFPSEWVASRSRKTFSVPPLLPHFSLTLSLFVGALSIGYLLYSLGPLSILYFFPLMHLTGELLSPDQGCCSNWLPPQLGSAQHIFQYNRLQFQPALHFRI